jgi:putative ABC transport system substrate-binding protein
VTTRRRLLMALGVGVLAAPFASFAQSQPAKIPRIGFLGIDSASKHAAYVEAFQARLRELGYVEGKNVIVDFRWAENRSDRIPELAAELVALKVDVLVTYSTPGTLAAKRATTTIPIVMAVSGDPVPRGIVASLAHPGGNVTGSAIFGPQLMAKRIELLKETMPQLKRVAVLLNPKNPGIGTVLKAIEATASSLKMELHRFDVQGTDEFNDTFSAIAKKRIAAVVVWEDSLFTGNTKTIADLAIKHRVTSIGFREFGESGGMIGYGENIPELFRRAAVFVDKILKGAKPADIPVEQATKFELIMNMKTARTLGIKIPQSILVRADRVIE